ncbi:MAG: flagellar hook-associated protein FlgK [Nitrospirota bacterium]
MSILGVLDIARSGLIASQVAMQVVGQNITNANTPGYSEQTVTLEPTQPVYGSPGQVGTGVSADKITRSYDNFIQNETISELQLLGQYSAESNSLSSIQNVFNDSNGDGISNAMSSFFSSLQDLANTPDGAAEREEVSSNASDLASLIQQGWNNLQSARVSADQNIQSDIGQINQDTSQIAGLNVQISQAQASGQNPNDLLDSRDQLLQDLSQKIGISTYSNQQGQLEVLAAGGRALVDGGQSNQLVAMSSSDEPGFTNVGFSTGSGQTVDITGDIQSGDLGGQLNVRDSVIPGFQGNLDQLAGTLTKEFNSLNSSGYGLDGSTGQDFFSPLTPQVTTGNNQGNMTLTPEPITDYSGLSLDSYNIKFTDANTFDISDETTGAVVASNVSFTPGMEIDVGGMQLTSGGMPAAGDEFTVSAAENAAENIGLSQAVQSSDSAIAAAQSSAALPGDNSNAQAMAALQNSPTVGGKYTFSDYYSSIVDSVGEAVSSASSMQDYHQTQVNNLNAQQQQVSGVSLDEEMTNLITYQRAYDAAAKLVSVSDEMMQDIVNMVVE